MTASTRFAAAIAALFVIPATACAQSSSSASAAIGHAVTASGAPGAVVLVVDRGKTIFDTAYGIRDIATKAPVTAATRFEIGSITKQFTAAAILQLKERGKLRLSDTLGKYVTAYAPGKNVTIRQLLNQISGIPNYTESKGFVALALSKPGTFAGILAQIAGKPLDFAPGTKWEYSNTNYVLLGHIVAMVSGMPWQTYVRRYIFSPAGMTQSAFMDDESAMHPMATGYANHGRSPIAQKSFNGWARGAGAIVSTASDLARWDAALFDGKIVTKADLALMTTPGHLANGSATEYGFGWVLDRYDGQQRIWHNGGTFGFSAANHVYPKLDQRFIVLVNDASVDADLIAQAAFEAVNPSLAKAEDRAAPGEDPAVTARAKEWLHRFETGDIDRSQLDASMNAAMTDAVVASAKSQLAPLGEPTSLVFKGQTNLKGATAYTYRATFSVSGVPTSLFIHMTVDDTGKISGYLLSPQ